MGISVRQPKKCRPPIMPILSPIRERRGNFLIIEAKSSKTQTHNLDTHAYPQIFKNGNCIEELQCNSLEFEKFWLSHLARRMRIYLITREKLGKQSKRNTKSTVIISQLKSTKNLNLQTLLHLQGNKTT